MLNKFIRMAILCMIALVTCITSVSAETSFVISPDPVILGPFVNFTNQDQVSSRFEQLFINFFDKNKTVLPTGIAIVNTLGYPNGKSTIKPLPHFEAGAAFGGGIYKYKRANELDKNNLEANPVVPSGFVNGGFHFGTGLTQHVDLTVKFFSLGWFYTPNQSMHKSDSTQKIDVELSKADFYSFGCKTRYNWFERKTIIPFLFSFGGISLNLGLDYLQTRVKANAGYSKTVTADFTLRNPFTGVEEQKSIELDGKTQGDATIEWRMLSLTPEAIVYFDFFYLLSLYTGPGLSFNTGTMNMNLNSNGTLTNKTALAINTMGGPIELVPANSQIATAKFSSKNRMYPMTMIPKWTVGIEINIWMVKLQVEAATILDSPLQSGTIQAGVRVDI